MDLVTAIAELEAGQSDEEMLVQLQARTVGVVGSLSGGDLTGLLAKLGLLSFVTDQVNATGTNSVIRNICIAINQRLLPDGGIQFDNPDNVALLDMFLADATVSAIISATGRTIEGVRGVILSAATGTEPEFDGLNMRQMLAVRNPPLINQSESNIVDVVAKKGRQQLLIVTVGGGLPEAVNLQFQVRNKFVGVWSEWGGSSVAGLTNKRVAGVYSARLPGDLIKSDEAQIKIICSYAIALTLIVE